MQQWIPFQKPVFSSNRNISDSEWHVDKPIMWLPICHLQQHDTQSSQYHTLHTEGHTDPWPLENNNAVKKAYAMSRKVQMWIGSSHNCMCVFLSVCPELKEREWWCCNQARSHEGRQPCWQRVGTHLQSRISGPQSLAFRKKKSMGRRWGCMEAQMRKKRDDLRREIMGCRIFSRQWQQHKSSTAYQTESNSLVESWLRGDFGQWCAWGC